MATNGHVRLRWQDLPAPVRARIEGIVGGAVVEAVTQSGGFSPGTADRIRTASGARAFVKAVSTGINERSAELARQEQRVTAALPAAAAVPRLLGGFDDGTWVVTVLEDIEGRQPGDPWADADVHLCAATLRDLAAVLTPAPVRGLRRTREEVAQACAGWHLIAADPPADLDPWIAANLELLQATAERGLAACEDGDTLVHCDIRGDNILIRPGGTAVVVDWPWATVGPDWFDLACLAMNVIVCGQDPAPALAGLDFDAVVGVVAAWAGCFLDLSRRTPPPGIPTVRAFQRHQADRLLPWLRSSLAQCGTSGTPARGGAGGALP